MAKNIAEVSLDRRQKKDERRKEHIPHTTERRAKVQRRRQIDPTTCERDYSDDEIQFMQALDAYKRTSGRMFPTCSEILEVIRGLGYVRVASETPATCPAGETGSSCSPDNTANQATAG